MALILESIIVPLAIKLLEFYVQKSKEPSKEFKEACERIRALMNVAATTEARWQIAREMHELQKK